MRVAHDWHYRRFVDPLRDVLWCGLRVCWRQERNENRGTSRNRRNRDEEYDKKEATVAWLVSELAGRYRAGQICTELNTYTETPRQRQHKTVVLTSLRARGGTRCDLIIKPVEVLTLAGPDVLEVSVELEDEC